MFWAIFWAIFFITTSGRPVGEIEIEFLAAVAKFDG
jgi:hypothetical protein